MSSTGAEQASASKQLDFLADESGSCSHVDDYDPPAPVLDPKDALEAKLRLGVLASNLIERVDIMCTDVGILRASIHTWTDDEIAQFEAQWPVGSKQRLGFDLLLHTAQRSGDVRQMTIHQIAGDRVIVRQEKTGQPIDIPQHPCLQKSLAASKLGHLVLLTTSNGKPYSEKGFGNWIKKAAVSAGLPHCSAHGLRKAAARRLAEAGCSVHEIMAITGHQSLKEVERYTREANRRGLADGAMKRVG